MKSVMKSKIIAYGERPITEFVLSICSDEDLNELFNSIKFCKDNKPSEILSVKSLKNIYIEAPLKRGIGTPDIIFQFENTNLVCEVKPRNFRETQKKVKTYEEQLKRYYEFIKNPSYLGGQELVKRLTKLIKGKENFLICVTDDAKFPLELEKTMKKLQIIKIGWLPYSIFEKIAERRGFEIMKKQVPHIWIEKKRQMMPS